MARIHPVLKPFLLLLELVLVVFVVYKLAAYSIEAEQAAMAEHTNWREQIGIGLAQTFLAAIIIFIYFIFWNFRIVAAIRKEKQRTAKYLNIGLLSLFPGLIIFTLLYWKAEKEWVKNKTKSYLAPVTYREIFRTSDNIIGFRATTDSLLILTNKLKLKDPRTTYHSEKERLRWMNADQQPIANSEELIVFQQGQPKVLAKQQRYGQFQRYYFDTWKKCLEPRVDPKHPEEIYRYDKCTHQELSEPALIGFSISSWNRLKAFSLDHNLFFITQPTYFNFSINPYFYIGHINDREAKVYRLDLSQSQELRKEFKSPYATFELFGTNRHLYLISRFRILEISL